VKPHTGRQRLTYANPMALGCDHLWSYHNISSSFSFVTQVKTHKSKGGDCILIEGKKPLKIFS